MALAGILYYIQDQLTMSTELHNFVRLTRMIGIYVIPTLWFLRRNGRSINDIGVQLPQKLFFLSLFGGMLIYCLVGLIFVRFEIFYGGWKFMSLGNMMINLLFIGFMAAITDYWTRGFILMLYSEHRGLLAGIVLQNVVWFTIHIYEIILLANYISYTLAILMTLFLGITGDLIAFKSKSVYGLMIGHFLLNLMIMADARYETFSILFS